MLSNLLSRPDAGPVACRAARAEEIHDALRVILSHDSRPADDAQVTDFVSFASTRRIDVREAWVAEAGGRIVWAVLPILSPGRTVLLFTPPVIGREPAAGQLIESACGHFAGRGVHLAQALLDPPDQAARAMYLNHNFRQMAELMYLSAAVRRPPPPTPLPAEFDLVSYSPETHPLFARAIAESYRDSLDCPDMNGLRDIEDVIAGHKASGEFDPEFWFVLLELGEPRGVLLLSRVPRTDAAEMVYIGLAPSARSRGHSDLLMRQALWAVGAMRLARLTLAVDSRNAPALKLYFRHGMQRTGSKIAFLRDLRRET